MSALLTWILEHEHNFRKARLPSLYSDFSVQRTTNPDGFAANVAAWQSALAHAARAGAITSTSGSDNVLVLQTNEQLIKDLESTQYGRPMGLAIVLDDAVQKGIMIPLQDFTTTTTSIYSKSWIPSPWQVVTWALRQIGLGHAYSGQRLKSGDLVIIANLEDVAGKLLADMQKKGSGLTDRVMAVDSFREDFSRLLGLSSVSQTDVQALLVYLHRDKGVVTYDDKTVKFRSPSSTQPEPLTHQDATIASLKLLIANLNIQCSSLSDRITSLSTTASQAVKSSNRVSALTALRSRKVAETTLSQRSATLHQLEEIYAKVEQAVDQVEVVRVMEASSSALKSLNKQIGGVERVEDLVEGLREEMEKVDEVGGVINEPLTGQATVDEGELDDELEAMEKEQKKREEDVAAEQKKREEEREAEQTRKRLDAIGEVNKEKDSVVDKEAGNRVQTLSAMSIDQQPEGSQAREGDGAMKTAVNAT